MTTMTKFDDDGLELGERFRFVDRGLQLGEEIAEQLDPIFRACPREELLEHIQTLDRDAAAWTIAYLVGSAAIRSS